jgi:hypothetical protein
VSPATRRRFAAQLREMVLEDVTETVFCEADRMRLRLRLHVYPWWEPTRPVPPLLC